MISLIRGDWPPGSNARLLDVQVRGAFGFTVGRRGDAGEVRARAILRGFPPSEPARPSALAAGPAAPPSRQQAPDRLLALLRDLGCAGPVMLDNEALAERLGVTIDATKALLHKLERRGDITRRRTGRHREIVLGSA